MYRNYPVEQSRHPSNPLPPSRERGSNMLLLNRTGHFVLPSSPSGDTNKELRGTRASGCIISGHSALNSTTLSQIRNPSPLDQFLQRNHVSKRQRGRCFYYYDPRGVGYSTITTTTAASFSNIQHPFINFSQEVSKN